MTTSPTTELWQLEIFTSLGPGDPGTWRPMSGEDLRVLPRRATSMMEVNAIRSYAPHAELGGQRACILKEHAMELLRMHRAGFPAIPARPIHLAIQRTVHVF